MKKTPEKYHAVRFNPERTRILQEVAAEIGYYNSVPVGITMLINAMVDCLRDNKIDRMALSQHLQQTDFGKRP